MTHIQITKGLNIPMKGLPALIKPSGEVARLATPSELSLNLQPFEDVKFRLLAKEGDVVKAGQPLAEDKDAPGRLFVSPAAGMVKEVRRGLKRRLLDIVIEVAQHEEWVEHPRLNPAQATREQLLEHLMTAGLFTRIYSRPFHRLANPQKKPRSIFVKAIESALLVPAAEWQVLGHEKDFQTGLNVLKRLTDGLVHLVHAKDTSCKAFLEAVGVQKHTAEGPHPVGNASLHIQRIDPIRSIEDTVWVLQVFDVIAIGHLFNTGRYLAERVIGIGGTGIVPGQTGYFRVREGMPVSSLVAGRTQKGWQRLISGDPLMGHRVSVEDFLGFTDYAFTVVPENTQREFLHFFRLGVNKYSMSRAYLSGHLNNADREYDFTTSLHGEHRAFIDATLYQKVQPLNIPTMQLVKAILAEDYDLAETLGLLDVAAEDFALPTFVCPSKMEMTDIVKKGLKAYAKEIFG